MTDKRYSADDFGFEMETQVLPKNYTFTKRAGTRVVSIKVPYDDLHGAIHSIPKLITEARIEYEIREGYPLEVEDMFITVAYSSSEIMVEIGEI